MSDIGDRIKHARKACGLSQEQLALAIGAAGQSTVGNYERGLNEPNVATATKLAQVLGVTAAWLLTGIESGNEHRAEQPNEPYQLTGSKYAFIRRFQIQAGAGKGQENGHEEISGSHAYRREWLDKKHLNAHSCVVIEVKGDSMDPTICDGDIVLVNMAARKLNSGFIYAFRTEEGVRLKRLHKQLDGRVRVGSDNANKNEFPDEYLTPDTEAEIIGLVVHRSGGV